MTARQLQIEISNLEMKAREKRKQLAALRKKYSRSLSQMFPTESATQPFSIDNRLDA